jgi:hypothetical protein
MKQKYAIIRDDEQRTVMIREYAELDKEMMSLLCEESYPQDAIAASIKEGHQAVVDVIRTNNMYPPTVFAGPIASAIEGLFKEGGNLSAELFFDDKELFSKEAEAAEEESDDDVEEDVAVDELLEDDDIDDGLEDDKVLKGLKSKIKKTEDDSESIEDVT